MLEYVNVRSDGYYLYLLVVEDKKGVFPFIPVLKPPCAYFLHSLPNDVVHIYCMAGSFANFLYSDINSPVTGWMTGKK